MKYLFLLLLFLSQISQAMPYAHFELKPFLWRSETIASIRRLSECMRLVKDAASAEAFRTAVRTTNEDPNLYIGYALGEFDNRAERDTAEALFKVEHPFFGTMSEADRLPFHAKMAMGFLTAAGLSTEELRDVRKKLLTIPPEICDSVVRRILSSRLSREQYIEIVNLAANDCDGKMAN